MLINTVRVFVCNNGDSYYIQVCASVNVTCFYGARTQLQGDFIYLLPLEEVATIEVGRVVFPDFFVYLSKK